MKLILNMYRQAIKLWKMFYHLYKHFDPFLNLFPPLYVPSIRKKAAPIVKYICLSNYLIHKKIFLLKIFL